jgi:hypothetical protein
MATKKRSRGRPALTAKEKKERSQRTKISFEMNPYQLAILESWMADQELIEGRSFSRSQASLHLVMSRLVKGLTKPEIDQIVEKQQSK